MFTSLLCSTAGSLHAQTERQQLQLGRRRWGLDVCARPRLCPWKANLVLLFCYIHRCLERSLEVQAFVFNSFRPPSKLLFYIALPGTPTVTKLSPHYSTVYKRDPIFMPEYQLLGPLTLPKARTGSGSHTAAPRNLVVRHCIESAQTNMVVSRPVC